MSSQVPSITVLRERATQLLGRGCVRGQLKAMMAGAFAAKNAGTPLDPESTSQELVTQCQGLINQADQDVLAILVRELLEFVENGGGGGGDAPAVIAPFPGIGAEGEYYAQQIRTTGATPQTFSLVSGALPYGMTLDPDSGIISGTAPYPYGALYEGVIGVENSAGSTEYVFQILINGTAATFTQDWTYPIAILGSGFSGQEGGQGFIATYAGDFTYDASGIASSSGSIPTTWEFITNQATPLPDGVTFNEFTGKTQGSPTNPDQLCTMYQYGVVYRNYFGYHQENYTMVIVPTIYWGEWHGALPATFTAENIQTDLFDDTTPGPRVIPGYNGISVNVAFAGALACNASGPNVLRFPAVSPARARIFAVPRAWFTGDVNGGVTSWSTFTSFTPTFPTPYQENLALTVNGIEILYDVYVIPSTTSAIDLFFLPNQPPSIFVSDNTTHFLSYIGDADFRPSGSEDNKRATLQIEVSSGLPVTYSTSGSLPTGMTWDEGTLTITGAPTDQSQVFERFFFSITATNDNGSRTLDLTFVVSAPIYWGEQSGSLPGTFTASDITAGLYNGTTPGPRVYPASGADVHGVNPGVYVMSAAALGFNGTYLPSFYGAATADAYYPALFFCPVTTSTIKVFAVPSKFFSGSWPQDPNGSGATRTFNPVVGPVFGNSGTATFNPAWPTPYQSGLMIDVNGIPTSYDIYVLQGSTGLYWMFS